MRRMIVFLDEQNVYRGARRAFSHRNMSPSFGNVYPIALSDVLAGRRVPGDTEPRDFVQVRIYTGLQDANRETKAFVAHQNRINAWRTAGAWVEARPLRYPRNWDADHPAQQKGVDVALALDFVMLALDDAYDVGVIFSSDTDLRPALEFVASRTKCTVETASWWSRTSMNRLAVPGLATWNHRLTEEDLKAVSDATDYAKA